MTQSFSNLEKICEKIEKGVKLPTPPVIALKIIQTVQKDDDCLEELIDIISTDAALTAKILKITNSSFYALANKISSVERAVSILGTNLIKNIALSFVIANDFRETNQPNGFDYDYFWRRSVTSAVTANLLSQLLGTKDDDIFVTALLHDIGVLIGYQHYRDAYLELLQRAQNDKLTIAQLERLEFGFDHQQIAFALIHKWNLPEHFTQPVAFHHEPLLAPEAFRHKTQIIYIADRIASIYTSSGNSDKIPEIRHQLADFFNLKPHVITSFLDNAALKSIEILGSFEIEDGGMKPYSQLLQEANEELGRLNISYEQLVLELKEAKEKSEHLTEQLKNANTRLNTLVYTDGLTGLYNHRYFQQSLLASLTHAQQKQIPLSLIIFDLDHFKQINDTYGHPVGDLVLNNLAATIKEMIRPRDILARYGGEEFAIILPNTNFEVVQTFSDRLRECVENTVLKYDHELIRVTISSGATTYEPKGQNITPAELIKTADRGLYTAKRNGRNRTTAILS